MKNEKGITTTSIVIYVIVVSVILATLSTISLYFQKQIKNQEFSEDGSKNFTSFISYFVEDIQGGNGIADENDRNTELTQIMFKDGTIYIYSPENKKIYKNNIEIAKNVNKLVFIIKENLPDKISINVDFQSGNINKVLTFYPKGI